MRPRLFVLIVVAAVAYVVVAPVRSYFTAVEQRDINAQTPGLFSYSDAFDVDFSHATDSDFVFPLADCDVELTADSALLITSESCDTVRAAFDGIVRLVHGDTIESEVIVVRHPSGLETAYYGNRKTMVSVGQSVRAGQIIGRATKTEGVATLLFAIMIDGQRIRPTIVIDAENHRLWHRRLLCCKDADGIYVSVVGGPEAPLMSGVDLDADPFADVKSIKINLADIESEQWAYPLPGAKVISDYGGRRHHSGVDLKTRPNDKIVAAFDGVVTRANVFSGYGNCVIIKHANGLVTLYGHQSKNLVKTGDRVKAGQVIGLTGRTGRASTEHLHLEVRFKGRHLNPSIVFDYANNSLQNTTLTLNKNGTVKHERNK